MGLSRVELWQTVLEDMGPIVAPLIEEAYRHELYWEWRDGDHSPHGMPWHTSFHASRFPGSDSLVCGRKAVYELLDPPAPAPREPFLEAWFDLGKGLEHQWVRRFARYGVLVSANVTGADRFQTGFEDEEHWLTSSVDAIILPRGWRKGHIVEIKTTSHEKVLAMMSRTPAFPLDHPKYVRQLKTEIGLAHEAPFTPSVNICDLSGAVISPADDYICPVHRERCSFESVTLEPPDDGELIYSSRENPLTTVSFRYFYDAAFMRAGRARLDEWREHFLAGTIPEHPRQGQRAMWSVPPCERCPLKRDVCKPDYQSHVTSLSDSHLIAFAQGIKPDYDIEAKRASVLFRWGVEDPLKIREEIPA